MVGVCVHYFLQIRVCKVLSSNVTHSAVFIVKKERKTCLNGYYPVFLAIRPLNGSNFFSCVIFFGINYFQRLFKETGINTISPKPIKIVRFWLKIGKNLKSQISGYFGLD